MSEFISIDITTPDELSANKIAQYLVEEDLVACAQIEGPITSIYKWKNIIEKSEEWRLVLKTVETNFKSIEKKVLEMHPYDVPQVVTFEIKEGYEKYLEWIDSVDGE